MKHADFRRFAVIAPAANMTLEYEYRRALPEGIVFNHARVSRPGWPLVSKASLQQMGQKVIEVAKDFIPVNPEIVLYACTSGSFVGHLGQEDTLAKQIEQQTGMTAITTSSAVVKALKALSVKRLFLITPYPDDINEAEIAFLQWHDFDVVGYDSFRCDAQTPIGSIDSDAVAALIEANLKTIKSAQAVFISCTNLLTFDKITALEALTARPVISSNSASLWAVLCYMNVATDKSGLGRLGLVTSN